MSEQSGTRIFVGNLSTNVSKEDLELEFSKYGKITSVWYVCNSHIILWLHYFMRHFFVCFCKGLHSIHLVLLSFILSGLVMLTQHAKTSMVLMLSDVDQFELKCRKAALQVLLRRTTTTTIIEKRCNKILQHQYHFSVKYSSTVILMQNIDQFIPFGCIASYQEILFIVNIVCLD